MISAALEAAYRATRYTVNDTAHPIIVMIDDHCAALGRLLRDKSASCGAIITAWNPRSHRLPTQENHERGMALEADIRQRGLQAVPVVASAEDPDWTEYGILILGIGECEAAEIGRTYGQNALVMVSLERPAYLVDLTITSSE